MGSGCIAAIDVGSSATRLVIAQIRHGQPQTLLRTRTAVRLGTEVFAHGRVGAHTVQLLVQAFVHMAERLAWHQVEAHEAVATSALRDAANGAEVVAAIEAHSGIAVQIISGAQEAALMRQALMAAWRRTTDEALPPDALLLDLGGGSLELMRAQDTAGLSLPMGTVRLLAQHPELQGPMSQGQVLTLAASIEAQLGTAVGAVLPAPVVLGTGGNVEAMAQMAPGGAAGPPSVALGALLPLALQLASMPIEQRARAFGLRAGRADLLMPAVLMVHAVGRIFGATHMAVPGAGIRDAMLVAMAQRIVAAG